MITKEQILATSKNIDNVTWFTNGPKTSDCIECSWREYVEKYPIGKILFYEWEYFTDGCECTYPQINSRTPVAIDAFKNTIKTEFADDFKLRQRVINQTGIWVPVSKELPPYNEQVVVAYETQGWKEENICFNHRTNDPMVRRTPNDWAAIWVDGKREPKFWLRLPKLPK